MHSNSTDYAWPTDRVDAALELFFDRQRPALAAMGSELDPVMAAAEDFVRDGGKRLRPLFAYWGYRGAGGEERDEVFAACSSLELLHACALVHDDVMDASDMRRGHPSVHRRLEQLHRRSGWRGSPLAFGEAAAILIGDLLFAWSDAMLHSSGMPLESLFRVAPVWDEMRTELMAGQYLDMLEQARGEADLGGALRVARYKSGKYTIERPLHVGMALACTDPCGPLGSSYSAYGLPLGEAFQMRDDVLGVFGDPAKTGKPAGDDLREGKRTALIAVTLQHATQAQAAALSSWLGDADLDAERLAKVRDIIVDTGALRQVEGLIEFRTAEAVQALASARVTDEARRALTALAHAVTRRSA